MYFVRTSNKHPVQLHNIYNRYKQIYTEEMNSIIRNKHEYYTVLGHDAVFICNYLQTYRIPCCLYVQGNFGTRRQRRSPKRRSLFTHRHYAISRKNFVVIKKDHLETRWSCKFISSMKETYTKLSNLRSFKGKKEINLYFILYFGALPPSRLGSLHSRGF